MSHPLSLLCLQYYLWLSLPALRRSGRDRGHARCMLQAKSRCALHAVSSVCQQCTVGAAQQASKRSSGVSCSTSMPQSARPAQAASYAQLRQARQNPLRHSTGTLKEVMSRLTKTSAAVISRYNRQTLQLLARLLAQLQLIYDCKTPPYMGGVWGGCMSCDVMTPSLCCMLLCSCSIQRVHVSTAQAHL